MAADGDGAPRWGRREFLARSFLFTGGALIATACGAASTPNSTQTKGKVTLNQWYHEYGQAGTLQAVQRYAAQYTKQNPHVAINIQWIPDSTYATKLFTALAGSSPPDIYEYYQTTIPMVKNKFCTPLDDILPSSMWSQFFSYDKAFTTYNGKTYAVKFLDDCWLIFYRTSMLKRAGVSTSPPTDFNDLVDRAQKLTTGNVKGLFIGNDGVGRLNPMIVESNGVNLVTGNRISFATQDAASALQGLHRLNQSNVLLKGYPVNADLFGAFTAGATAMILTGFWNYPQIKDAIGDDFGVWAWPKFSSAGQPRVGAGGWAQYISGHSQHIAEAKAYVKWLWLDNTSDQMNFNTAFGYHVPPRRSAAASASILKSGVAKDVVDLLHKYGYISGTESSVWDTNVATAWSDAVTGVVVQGQPALSTLQSAQAQAQKEVQSELGSS